MTRFLSILIAGLWLAACGGEGHAGRDDHADDHADGSGETGDHAEEAEAGTATIRADVAERSGIATAVAGPARIRETIVLHGTIVPDPRRVFRLHARYPGIVREVRRNVGERVRAGETVAVVESDESLQRYDIKAPAAGVVVTRDANPGVGTGDAPLLTIVDLSTVWVELASFQHDMRRIRAGQAVVIADVDGHVSADGRVDNVAAVGSAASQSMTVRVVLPNPDGHWRPGLFVTGEVVVAEESVPLAVRVDALQSRDGRETVFERSGDTYTARPLELGRRDREWAEVRGGLAPGTTYVSANSYLVKAEIEKPGAAHAH